jgi:hypothetical protein
MGVFRNENAAAHPFRATQQQGNALDRNPMFVR